jgi:hypothetical protein
MASAAGEDPNDTRAKILFWIETMYRFAIGEGITDVDELKSLTVSAKFGQESYDMKKFFTMATDPKETDTIAYLINRGTKFKSVLNSRRAIGSVLHVVQDSFARGHVKRTLKNPDDLIAGANFQFKPGTYGQFGEIVTFHTYEGQDGHEHDKYDKKAKFAGNLDPDNLESFNQVLGGRNAINFSIKVLDFWSNKTSYTNGPKDLFENDIFKLSTNATPADTKVD